MAEKHLRIFNGRNQQKERAFSYYYYLLLNSALWPSRVRKVKFSTADKDAGGSLFNDPLTFMQAEQWWSPTAALHIDRQAPCTFFPNFDTNTFICIITVTMINSNYQENSEFQEQC